MTAMDAGPSPSPADREEEAQPSLSDGTTSPGRIQIASPATPGGRQKSKVAAGHSPRILVIEDEVAIADFVHRGLESEGYRVESVFDGLDGERQALDGEFDLVILDWMLPGRDGLEILAAIRQRKPDLPVLLLTAKADARDRAAALKAGATAYLTKPFAFAELTAGVMAHLRQAPKNPPERPGAPAG
jgi:CheY-like chemotaxis protein